MKTLRPIEIERCCICGEQFDRLLMHEIFTGRKQYICQECHARGNRQIAAKRESFLASHKGKITVENCEKNK